MCGKVYVCHRTTCKGQFSLFNICALGLEFSLVRWVANALPAVPPLLLHVVY